MFKVSHALNIVVMCKRPIESNQPSKVIQLKAHFELYDGI